jgi:hypothetical protein
MRTTIRTWLSWIALSLAMSAPAVAGDRAGAVVWQGGLAGIPVKISPPMSDANYSAIVQPANTADFSTTTECVYFNVLHLTPTQFEVQLKNCHTGIPVPTKPGVNITLEWIIVTHPE